MRELQYYLIHNFISRILQILIWNSILVLHLKCSTFFFLTSLYTYLDWYNFYLKIKKRFDIDINLIIIIIIIISVQLFGLNIVFTIKIISILYIIMYVYWQIMIYFRDYLIYYIISLVKQIFCLEKNKYFIDRIRVFKLCLIYRI